MTHSIAVTKIRKFYDSGNKSPSFVILIKKYLICPIYRKPTISDDPAQIEASIDALVSPVGNSFSEKCAAVKLAFLKEIPERVAKNYYIQVPQGGAKGISLDRSLVEWETAVRSRCQ